MLGGQFASYATFIDQTFASLFSGSNLKASHAEEIKTKQAKKPTNLCNQ